MERHSYRLYIAEGLRVISESAAKRVQGNYLAMRWQEAMRPAPPEKPAEVVALEIIHGAGLHYREVDA